MQKTKAQDAIPEQYLNLMGQNRSSVAPGLPDSSSSGPRLQEPPDRDILRVPNWVQKSLENMLMFVPAFPVFKYIFKTIFWLILEPWWGSRVKMVF